MSASPSWVEALFLLAAAPLHTYRPKRRRLPRPRLPRLDAQDREALVKLGTYALLAALLAVAFLFGMATLGLGLHLLRTLGGI